MQNRRLLWILWGAVFFITGPGLIEPYQIFRALFMLILALGCLGLPDRQSSGRWFIPKPFLWIGASITWSALSIIWAYNPVESVWTLFLYFTPVISLLVVSQKWGKHHSLIAWVGYLGWIYALIVAVLLVSNGIRHGWTNQELYRIHYPSGHKSMIAAILVGWFPFMLNSDLPKKAIQGWVLLALALILFLQSRAAFLALLAFGVIWLLHQPIRWKTYRKLWVIPVIGLLIWWINPGRIRLRIHPSYILQSPTASDRLVMWEKTLRLIREKPLSGFGLGQWKVQWPALGIPSNQYYSDQDEEVVWTHAHNDWLETAAELGLPGSLLLFLFLASVWYYSGYLDPKLKSYSRALVGAYIMFSIFDFPRLRLDIQWIYLSWWVWSLKTASLSGLSFKVNIPHKIASAGVLVLMITYGMFHYADEYWVRKLWLARAAKQPDKIIALSGKINRSVMNLDEAAVPIDWYAGMAALDKGQQADALNDFRQARLVHPNHHDVWNNLGVIYFQQSQLDSAIICFGKAKQIAPSRWEYTRNLVNAYAAGAQYSEALKILDNWKDNADEKEALRRKIVEFQKASTSN